MYSDQPMMPSSVVISRKELTRQPASQCRSSILVIFIAVSSATSRRLVKLREVEPVAERVGHRHHSRAPFRTLDRGFVIFIRVSGDRAVESIDPGHLDMHRRTGTGVAVMLAEMQCEPGARYLHVERKIVTEAMLPIDLKAEEAAVELLCFLDREHAQDRHLAADAKLIRGH